MASLPVSGAGGADPLLSVLALEPLVLQEDGGEFAPEDQEPDKHRPARSRTNDSGRGMTPEEVLASPMDFLGIKTDPQLARFFEAIESEHASPRELLLLSCSGHRRDVDELLLAESRRPVVQGRRRTAAEKEKDKAAAAEAEEQQRRRRSSASQSAEAAAAASAAAAAAPSAAQAARAGAQDPAQAQFHSPPRHGTPSSGGDGGEQTKGSSPVLSPTRLLWQRLTKDRDKDKDKGKDKGKSKDKEKATAVVATSGEQKQQQEQGDVEKAGGSPTRTRIKDWLRNKINKDKDCAASDAAAADDKGAALTVPGRSSFLTAPPPSRSPMPAPKAPSPLQRQAPPARRHSHALLPDDGSPAPPMSYSGNALPSGGGGSKGAMEASRLTTRRNSGSRPSHSRNGSASLSLSHNFASEAERAARAPTAPPPSPCTILLTNLALYVFPPAIAVEVEVPAEAAPEDGQGQAAGADGNEATAAAKPKPATTRRITKHFLVYNEFLRVSLSDIALVSLPYRAGLTRAGGDFALRITDFAITLTERPEGGASVVSGLASAGMVDGPLRPFQSLWLQAPRNCRSLLVESLSDAIVCLTGRPVDISQPDYAQLIEDILSGQTRAAATATAAAAAMDPKQPIKHAAAEDRLAAQVREAALMATWKAKHVVHSGYLHHRATHVWPTIVSGSSARGSGSGDVSGSSGTDGDEGAPRISLRSREASSWSSRYFVVTGPEAGDRWADTVERVLRHFATQQDMESWRYVGGVLAAGKALPKHLSPVAGAGSGTTALGLPAQIELYAPPPGRGAVLLREASALAGEGTPFSFELLVFPRISSMREEQGGSGADESSDAPPPLSPEAAAALPILQAALPPDVRDHPLVRASVEAVLEYGFTRHLFQVPAPPPPGQAATPELVAASSPGLGSTAAAVGASAAAFAPGAHTTMSRVASASVSLTATPQKQQQQQQPILSNANQRKQQAFMQSQSAAAPSTPARPSSLSVSSGLSSTPVLTSPGRSAAAASALMNADLRCWVRALRAAIAGGSSGADSFATPPTSPAAVAGRNASASVSVTRSSMLATHDHTHGSFGRTLAPPIFDPVAHRTPSPSISSSGANVSASASASAGVDPTHVRGATGSLSNSQSLNLSLPASPSPAPSPPLQPVPPASETTAVAAAAAVDESDALSSQSSIVSPRFFSSPSASPPADSAAQPHPAAATVVAVGEGGTGVTADLFSFPAAADAAHTGAGALSPGLHAILPSSPSELP